MIKEFETSVVTSLQSITFPFVQTQQRKSKRISTYRGCEDFVVLDSSDFNDAEYSNPNLKHLYKLKSDKQLKRITNAIFDTICEYARNVEVAHLLGLLLMRCEDAEIRAIGRNLWENRVNMQTGKSIIPIETALAVYTDCSLGRQTCSNQRKIFSGFNILPPWCRLRGTIHSYTNNVEPSFATYWVYFPLFDAVKITTNRIFQDLASIDIHSTSLQMNMKFGFDGSGSHAIYNQSNNVNTNNMILTMFCPLTI